MDFFNTRVLLVLMVFLFSSCTALFVTQKTPNGSKQSVSVVTKVDSTNISLKPALGM